ncbi:tetratricopeptide repeat protein [Marivirga arenosa]|uniref:Tetratricopeptide repeat protein n=1 Tax=Marivirga arenosa TaxID=3059076 RepID=A0AA51X4K1_9BACT|nr:tetratricopeptide repeat protein [Marivirga sp. BKB1-2]WNB16905.1 tetratricopeptide repeat protein [Marivirga sp. BKB1-2]
MNTQKSIVVLPFENISSDPDNEYFANGITEEIINALSKVEGLKVTARTSSFAYKNKPIDIRIIGNQLGVATALEGSIRKAGNRIRVSAQLIKTENGFQVWSESFDRDLTDIFELQDEISLIIADKIRENFGHLEIEEHLVTQQTDSIEAYSYYLKGRHYQLRWNFDEFELAIEAYKKSIELDSKFDKPYFGLVQCYGLLASWGALDKEFGLLQAEKYLNTGLKINNKSSVAYFALATQALWIEWKPYFALGLLKEALKINPNDSEALESAAEAHIALGNFQEAISKIEKALDVNPLSANHHFTMGNIHYLQGNHQIALKSFKRSLEIDPSWEFSLQVSCLCYIFLKNKQALEEILAGHSGLAEREFFIPLYDAINHHKDIDLNSIPKTQNIYFPWSLWILIYSKQYSEALEHLKLHIDKKQGQYLNFQREPLNAPLKKIEGYKEIVETVFDQPKQSLNEDYTLHSNVLIPKEDQLYYKAKLDELMNQEALYASDKLSLRELANAIDLHPNKLSWLLNEVLGKNFNEYINGLRIEDFKIKALDPHYSHFSLLGIAYESGFSSKSVFNDFFKKTEGLTPSAWVKLQS